MLLFLFDSDWTGTYIMVPCDFKQVSRVLRLKQQRADKDEEDDHEEGKTKDAKERQKGLVVFRHKFSVCF